MKTIQLPIIVNFACLLLSTSIANAQEVGLVAGDIYFRPEASWQQLTTRADVNESVLSPDGQWIAFIRATPQELISVGTGNVEATEVWIMKVNGAEEHCLLKGHVADRMQDVLAGLHSLQFSPKGKMLYFMSAAWVTSDALHAVDIKTGAERYVCSGNWFEMILRGQYAGHLLVNKHRYFLGGGSYDWTWLVAPDGTLIDPVADPDSDYADQQIETFRKLNLYQQTETVPTG